MKAPVVIFAYNRPYHLNRTLVKLRENIGAEDTDVTIYCDGPKGPDARSLVEDTGVVADNFDGFRAKKVIKRDRNLGLADSIISGVSEHLSKNEFIIVLEDDMETSPYFLKYMNDALLFYKDENKVASIHAYVYPTKEVLPETFFLKGADCWGWATWRRAWSSFNINGKILLNELRRQRRINAFDLDGSYCNSKMLEDQTKGKNNSWAIRWAASCFLSDMLTLYPGCSLVQNIGNDGSGSHCNDVDVFTTKMADEPIEVSRIPLEESFRGREAIKSFFKANPQISTYPTVLGRIKKFARNFL